MAQPSESQIEAAWEVDGKPRGIPYPDYRTQYIAQNAGGVMPSAARGAGGGGGAGAGDNAVTSSGGSAFLADLAHMTSGDINTKTVASGGDGSLDYYKKQSAAIQEALDSPGVSDARKQELRQTQAELDDTYFPARETDAKTTLQNAGSDDDALKALQAIEALRSTGGSGVSGSTGGAVPPDFTGTINNTRYIKGQAVDPALAKNGPINDPTDVAEQRREYDEGGFQYQGVSFEEYQQMVKEANPDGNLRYTSPTAKNLNGTAKTFSVVPDNSKSPGAVNGASTGVRNAQTTADAETGYFDNVTQRALGTVDKKNASTDAEARAAIAKLTQQGEATKTSNQGYADQEQAAANTAIGESKASTARYTAAADRDVASNQTGFDNYVSGIAPYQTKIAGTTRSNVAFDPEGLADQRAALAQGQNIAGGSLDYTSQGAQAYADPADVQRALDGINMLRENATTGGDDQRQNLQIARDEYDHGGENQQHIYDLALDQLEHGGDKQRDVYDRYNEISHPEMTADERNILAQSQQQYATLDKSNRDAVSKDLSARGINSGAAQIAGQQTSQDQLGQQRVAGVLGAQAQSVQRAFAALQGMQSTADQLRTGDQNSLSIAGRAATDLRTGNQNAEQLMQSAANALRAGDLAAANAYTVAAQRQREQGFQEEYDRGIAADNASANNQSTRLGGAQIQANEANSIRSANDSVNMFNNEQQGITDRYNTTFEQSEDERLTGLQQSTFNNRQTTIGTNQGIEGALARQSASDTKDRFGYTDAGVQTGLGVNASNHAIDSQNAGNTIDEGVRESGRTSAAADQRIGVAGQRVNLSGSTNKQIQDAIDKLSGAGYGV